MDIELAAAHRVDRDAVDLVFHAADATKFNPFEKITPGIGVSIFVAPHCTGNTGEKEGG
jgi:hypothetical protein